MKAWASNGQQHHRHHQHTTSLSSKFVLRRSSFVVLCSSLLIIVFIMCRCCRRRCRRAAVVVVLVLVVMLISYVAALSITHADPLITQTLLFHPRSLEAYFLFVLAPSQSNPHLTSHALVNQHLIYRVIINIEENFTNIGCSDAGITIIVTTNVFVNFHFHQGHPNAFTPMSSSSLSFVINYVTIANSCTMITSIMCSNITWTLKCLVGKDTPVPQPLPRDKVSKWEMQAHVEPRCCFLLAKPADGGLVGLNRWEMFFFSTCVLHMNRQSLEPGANADLNTSRTHSILFFANLNKNLGKGT